jgi:uncharacterized protein (DUF1499 family)
MTLIPVVPLCFLNFMAVTTPRFGVTNGRLAACPNSPNCVSTQAEDAAHRIEPFAFTGDLSSAMQRLKSIIARQPRMKIVAETDNYLHVEAASRLFRFVDDVEFFLDEAAGIVHFRSASRVGHFDLGVNRARMETLRSAWVETSS